ncbi:maleylpyruvate isomerase family mycothiol-dependent enzyme [Kitasatospora kifunensis]|uniref:Maleylpyruvate isomerase n=1 Tax=Kitasatospora kifunensis TaxID=58351 RepID=A0A7W7VT85_KITKI|nr:maleylpyruvate isomerase family mycothiol-dependent enzyme [Kitasatospora kifunensis]MBB4921508.1 maleylpyruvate isomerase [Kitasatospora kifunensis]
MLIIIEEITQSLERLSASLAALTDADAQAPSLLPGWTRGHAIAHLARSADAYVRLLTIARTGVDPASRADAAALARSVEEAAARPAGDLVADLHASFARLHQDVVSMPADSWDTLVTALAGWRHPAWYTLRRCWRELETHHVDLGLGYRTTDWPTSYVTWALDDTIAALSTRGFPVTRIDAPDLGRSWVLPSTGPTVTGPGHVLLGWLSGRLPNAPLTSDLPLPTPPSWPLPPSPGWS